MSKKKLPLIFEFKGTLFSDIFESSKNELARAILSFSHGPHLKKVELGKILQFVSIRGRMLHLCTKVLVLSYK